MIEIKKNQNSIRIFLEIANTILVSISLATYWTRFGKFELFRFVKVNDDRVPYGYTVIEIVFLWLLVHIGYDTLRH